MREILKRVPKSSVLHLVFCDNMQEAYFCENKGSNAGESLSAIEKNNQTVLESEFLRVSGDGDTVAVSRLNVGERSQQKRSRVVLFIPFMEL